MQYQIRLAVPSDAKGIAQHLCLAGGGLMEFLLDEIVPGVKADQLLAISVAEEGEALSYQNAVVVETKYGIQGLLLSYPFSDFNISKQMQMFVEKERLDHVRELYSHRIPDSYYIHALSVDEKLAGKGIGKTLLELSYEIAAEDGYDDISLHVWNDNTRARELYQKNGFKDASYVKIDKNLQIKHEGGMCLMRRSLISNAI